MRLTFGSMRGTITKAEYERAMSIPIETPEERLRHQAAANDAFAADRAKYLKGLEIPKRQLAFYVLKEEHRKWPAELRPMKGVAPNWKPVERLIRHLGSALVMVPQNTMLPVLWSWYSFHAVKRIEQEPNLTQASVGIPLPRIQIATSTELIQKTFGTGQSPSEWVDLSADLVAIWLDSGAKKHEAAIGGLVDVMNVCESRGVPLWLGCSRKWRYGSKHPLHHPRIDEWIETVPTFELGPDGLCA